MFTPLETKIFRKKMWGSNKKQSKGFTIVETMIFLVVSMAVFGTAVATISTQNRRTAFAQAARDVELQLQDVFNDVENGFYPSSNNFTCSRGLTGPSISAGANQQGTNEGCIFIGKLVEFGPGGQKDRVVVSTLVGNATNSEGEQVQALFEEAPPAILENETGGPKDTRFISADVEIENFYVGGSPYPGLGVVSGFAQYENENVIRSGIVRTSLVNFNGEQIEQIGGGVLCLQEKGGGGRTAEIKIAVDGQRLATSSIINPSSGRCE
jgi:type II secretory pathway pseudopilin PulG